MLRRASKYLLLAFPVTIFWAAREWAPPPLDLALPSSGVQVTGPSAMLRLQREGEAVLDLRSGGRAIPGAIRRLPVSIGAPPLIVSRDQAQAQRWARERGWRGVVRWVPARLVESPPQPGVAQMSARQAWARAQRGQVQIIDVSEADEWDAARLPNSKRVPWSRILAGDRSWASKQKALVFT